MAVSIPRASRIAILGTSLVQQNHIGDHNSLATSARGWMSWAEVLSHGRLHCPVYPDPSVISGWEPSNKPGVSRFFSGLNFGVSGQKAIEIERRIPRLLQSDFDLIIVDAGTNDIMVETKETIAATRARIVTALLNAGKTVILLPILARGTVKWPAGGAERAKAHWINRQSVEFANNHSNCHLFDWNSAWINADSNAGEPYSGFSDDGTHFAIEGAFAVGQSLVSYLESIIPHTPARLLSKDDCYDPKHNPTGNLATDLSALTITSLCETSHPIGGELINPGLGTWIEAICDVDVPSHENITNISLRLIDHCSDAHQTIALAPFHSNDGTAFPFPSSAWSGTLRTPPLKLLTDKSPPQLFLDVKLHSNGSPLEIKVSRIEVRAIPSPIRI